MILLLVIAVWLLIGAATGVVEARHGHWHKGWAVSAILGPFAIPLLLQARRLEPEAVPARLESGHGTGAGLSVLIGIDGSDPARHAAATVTALLGNRVGRLTLASVLDFETATRPGVEIPGIQTEWPERRQAVATLHRMAHDLAAVSGLRPGTVLLAGEPSAALAAHAAAHRYDLVVAGTRGRGMAKMLFGSCAEGLAKNHGAVPVLLVPLPARSRQTAGASPEARAS